MKKILGLIASPRKLGNCELVVKEINNHIVETHELTLLRLSDFNIQPCKGCYQCLFKEGTCIIQHDDFSTVFNTISESDAVILATPTYFLGPNACLKMLLDRGLAFYSQAGKLWGKPSVGVGIAGIQGKEGYTLLGIESFLKIIMSEIKQVEIIYGALPGEVFLNEHNRALCAELGKALFDPVSKKKEPVCPLCGGDTFRFLRNNSVKCMLCSNSGTISMKSGKTVFEIKRGEHELFLTKKDALEHQKWLIQMKERFTEQKNKLKAISASYMKEGNWIKPLKKPSD